VRQRTKGDLEGPRQPKVGDFDDTLFIDQQILWFQISMDYSSRMTKIKSLNSS
jgi:hypothetical protein